MRSAITELLSMKDFLNVAGVTQTWFPLVWQHARLEVQMHGVAPLLYSRFLDYGALSLLDSSFQDYLNSQYLLNSKRIQRVQEILQSILLESDARSINVMPLKGSVLINEYYKNKNLRPMADIDLLINWSDETEMEKILTSLGYHLLSNTPRHRSYISDNRISSIVGEHPDNPIKIELHTKVYCETLYEQYDITGYMWKNAEQGFLKLKSIMKPSRTMLLIHILLHASYHQHEGALRAIQLYDIHIITKSFKDNDWSQFKKIVEHLGCEKLVYTPLVLAACCFEIYVPDSIMNELHLKTPKGLKSMMNNYSFQEFIANNELQTLIYLSQNIKNSFYKKALLLTSVLLSKSFISSIQLEWCGSRKKRLREAMNLIVPPAARIDNLGYFIGSLLTFMIFFLTTITKHLWLHRLREKIIHRFKLLIFRHEAKYENIKINIVDDNEK